jgi:3-ketosteroid 9alpha-monooxygenase subunit A
METARFPRGWFVVAWSAELAPGAVKPLHYFDEHLVLFRTEAGEAVVMDAHCPHLGAHLGHGGTVEGDAIVCPFHAWRFDGTGTCTRIPYSERIPRQATLRTWKVTERSGCIFVWHDAFGGAPAWEVPTITNLDNEAWTPWFPNQIEVATHPREIVENVADKQHFPVVHRTDVSVFENIYDAHRATQHTVGVATPPMGGKDHFDIEATYHGPAFQISDMKGVLHSTLLLAHTPVTETLLHLRFAVSLRRAGPRTDEFAGMYVENLRRGFHEDISIWENKKFRERPRLVAEDGPVGRLRTWYRSFYTPTI